MIRLYYNTIIIDDIRHVRYRCFSLCLVEGTHREHVQLAEVDAPDVAHVDGTLSMLNMSRIHNSKSVRVRWLFWTDCVSSDKSTPFCQLPTSGCMSSKLMHLVRTMQNQTCHLVRIVRIQYGFWPFLR